MRNPTIRRYRRQLLPPQTKLIYRRWQKQRTHRHTLHQTKTSKRVKIRPIRVQFGNRVRCPPPRTTENNGAGSQASARLVQPQNHTCSRHQRDMILAFPRATSIAANVAAKPRKCDTPITPPRQSAAATCYATTIGATWSTQEYQSRGQRQLPRPCMTTAVHLRREIECDDSGCDYSTNLG